MLFRASFLLFLALVLAVSSVSVHGRTVSVQVNVDVPSSSSDSASYSPTAHLRDLFSSWRVSDDSDFSAAQLNDAEAEAEGSRTENKGFQQIPNKRCGSKTPLLQLTSLESTQWPLVEGTVATIRLSGTLTAPLNSGKFSASVKKFGISFFKKDMPIPSLYLPKPIGPFTGAMTFNVPSKKGMEVDIQVKIFNEEGKEYGCIAFEADV